jgi:hypothetical protein
MADVESEILVREIGRLGGWFGGGIGARWAARRLPSIPFETNFELQDSLSGAASAVEALLTKIGRRVPELESNTTAGLFHAVVGSGHLNLNPTVVRIQLQPLESFTSVFIRAVAKEGAIKQHSAQQAVERIRAALVGKAS